jgi:glycosyltransferase 2 family protein
VLTPSGAGLMALLLLPIGLAVLGLSALPVRPGSVSALEADVFGPINQLPASIFPAIWPFMQLGAVAAPLVLGAVALLSRRFRLAAGLFLSGPAAWMLAKLVKGEFGRGRPADLLGDVTVRGEPGLGFGFVSGHTAVAFALAAVAAPYLGRRARLVAWGLAAVVGMARMYVGAHLPLDVLGGAGLGLVVGAVVSVIVGRFRSRAATVSS